MRTCCCPPSPHITQVLRVFIIGIKQLARAIAQRQASSTSVNVQVCRNCVCSLFLLNTRHQFTDGVSLAVAAADAAAEQDAEDVDGAAGDAPACPLCLCSRKQVHVPCILKLCCWCGSRHFGVETLIEPLTKLQAACTSCGHVFCWRCIAGMPHFARTNHLRVRLS